MGRQRDRNRMAAVMASVREREMDDVPKSTGPLPETVLAIIELQHPSPSADIRRLVTEVRSLRSGLSDLLLTRQAHQQASEEEMRLSSNIRWGDDLDDEADRLCVEASARTAEAELAYEAAWQRARSLLAGEPHEQREGP